MCPSPSTPSALDRSPSTPSAPGSYRWRRSFGFGPRLVSLALVALLILAWQARGTEMTAAHAQAGDITWQRVDIWEPGYNPGSLLDPAGADAGPGGVFFVADSGHDRVVVVDAAGDIVRDFGGLGDGPAELRRPRDVAVDAARDRIYVVDTGNRRISVFRLDGSPLLQWRTAGPDFGFVPHAVTVSPDTGQVFVLSRLPWGHVDRFSPDGTWQDGWGDIGTSPGGMQFPEDLAIMADGRVVVADTVNNRLQIFDIGGQARAVYTLRSVRSVSVDPASGLIYALHLSGPLSLRHDRVSVLQANGDVVQEFDSLPPERFEPGIGVAVGGGRLAITTGFGSNDGLHALRQYDIGTGAPRVSTAASPLDHAAFLRPVALEAAPSDGRVHIVDSAIDRVRRYETEGSFAGLVDGGAADEIDLATDGSIYLGRAPILGDVRLRKLAADGNPVWDKPCDCISGLGIASGPGDQRVMVTDAFRRGLQGFDQSRMRTSPVISYTVANAGYAWLVDVDSGPDGRAYGAGGDAAEHDVYVFDPEARPGSGPLASWDLEGAGRSAERISVSPEGSVFVLGFDGRVDVFEDDGTPLALLDLDPAPGFGYLQPRDIAAGPDRRLYLLDGASDRVMVYEPRAVTATPTPTTEPEPPCVVRGNKSAAPDLVAIDEDVRVELSLDIECRPGTEPRADIVLILDRSNSMAGNRPGEKLYEARAAARRFVQQLDLTRHRVAVLSFSDIVSLDAALTNDEALLLDTLDRIRADGRTDIAGALERALEHLGQDARPEALPVVLLMTDGNPSRTGQPYVDAVRQGARARGRGALTYAIGLGDDVDAELLTAVVGAPERYFFAPTPEELDPIYQQLSEAVGGVVATDLELIDVMGPDVSYVPGSAQPAPAVEAGDTLTWRAQTIPEEGLRFGLRVQPQRTGLLPTNTRAVAEYSADGRRYRFEFPIPEVLVVDAATPTPTATAVPTSQPGTVYLPFLARELCLPKDRERGVDVMLVIDTSSSMRGSKLDGAISAARTFVALVDGRRDRVGLASFSSAARREYVLTQDLAAVSRQLGGLVVGVGTRIDLGLEVALEEIRARGRDRTPKMIVLLSDGQPAGGSEDRTLELAQLARQRGVTVFAVGLGTDVDGAFMRALARTPGQYFYAPDEAALRGIYEGIASTLPCR